MRTFCLLLALSAALRAQPALTVIKDTIYNLDGSPLNGNIQITNTAFAAGGFSIAAGTKSFPVHGGAVNVALVPTSAASPPTAYTVAIVSNGSSSPTLWSVPSTSAVESVADVTIFYAPGPDVAVAWSQLTALPPGLAIPLTGNCAGSAALSASHGVSVARLGGSPAAGNCNGSTYLPEYGTVLTESCTLGRLFAVSSAAGSDSSDGIITVQDEASATSITCTIGTGTACSDTTDTAASTAGHRIWVNGTTTSTNLANLAISIECR